jgi:hypothetical protein
MLFSNIMNSSPVGLTNRIILYMLVINLIDKSQIQISCLLGQLEEKCEEHYLSFCTFSFGHCVVCSSSIYSFWLPLWYLQTLLKTTLCNIVIDLQREGDFLCVLWVSPTIKRTATVEWKYCWKCGIKYSSTYTNKLWTFDYTLSRWCCVYDNWTRCDLVD